jgi:(1->4)-alpha-D-glucan 1-alpha-D-glucosylmutase
MDARLEALARLHGIEPGYHDIWGNWHGTSDETARALLRAMGIDAHDAPAAEAALAARDREAWRRAVPPVSVLRAAQLPRGVRIQLQDAALERSLSWRLVEESGEAREEPFTPLKLSPIEEHEGGAARAFWLPLPHDLAEGERCYLPPALANDGRAWGATVQLYGVRSASNAGIGNFSDLRACAEAWGERGAAILGTNPLHALSTLGMRARTAPRAACSSTPFTSTSRRPLTSRSSRPPSRGWRRHGVEGAPRCARAASPRTCARCSRASTRTSARSTSPP